jgi:peptidyl-prolyl cis-trans isomerase B (cyclophilin B)
MATAGPNPDGSQFFLTFKATPHLNGKHTVFGQLSEGLGTLKDLEANGSGRGTPKKDLHIKAATIIVE